MNCCRNCLVEFKAKVNTKGKFCSRACWREYEGKDSGRSPLCKLGYGGGK